jgi:hypothetical protein
VPLIDGPQHGLDHGIKALKSIGCAASDATAAKRRLCSLFGAK